MKKIIITILLFTDIVCFSFRVSGQITTFPNPNEDDYGYTGMMIEYKDSLYFKYRQGPTDYIAKFSGDSFRLLPSVGGVSGFPTIYNDQLFYIFQVANKNRFGKINVDGSITLFDNPDNGAGPKSKPIEYNGKLYFQYTSSQPGYTMGVFDGNTVSLIQNPDNSPGHYGEPIIFDNALYWKYRTTGQTLLLSKFDGSAITVYGNAGSGEGVSTTDMVIYNNKLFCTFNGVLSYFNGSDFTQIPFTEPNIYPAYHYVHDGKLWMMTVKLGENRYRLATYNDTVLNYFGPEETYNFGFNDKIVYNGQLYFRKQVNGAAFHLAKIDGDQITVIPNPLSTEYGYAGLPMIYDGKLYFNFWFTFDTRPQLARYDGSEIVVYPHVRQDIENYIYNHSAPFLEYKGSLFFGHITQQISGPKIKLAKLTDTLVVNASCANGSIVLNAGIVGNTYQWQLNTGSGYQNITNGANYNGVNTASLAISGFPSSWYGNKYRVLTNQSVSQEYILTIHNDWTGAISNAWDDPGNWSCGMVPDANTDVTIASGNVVINSNVTVRTLTILAPGAVTVNTGNTLTVLY